MTTHRYVVEVEVDPDADRLGFTNPHEAAGYVRAVLEQVAYASRGALRVTSLSGGPVAEVPPTDVPGRWQPLPVWRLQRPNDRVRYTLTGIVEYVTLSGRSVVVRTVDDIDGPWSVTLPRMAGKWEIRP